MTFNKPLILKYVKIRYCLESVNQFTSSRGIMIIIVGNRHGLILKSGRVYLVPVAVGHDPLTWILGSQYLCYSCWNLCTLNLRTQSFEALTLSGGARFLARHWKYPFLKEFWRGSLYIWNWQACVSSGPVIVSCARFMRRITNIRKWTRWQEFMLWRKPVHIPQCFTSGQKYESTYSSIS